MSDLAYKLIKWQRICNSISKKERSDRSFYEKVQLAVLARLYPRIVSLAFGGFLPVAADIGEDIDLPHGLHGVFVSQHAKIGKNVTLLHHVTIGSNIRDEKDTPEAPIVGDNVFVGCNACIIGRSVIGDGARIGAGVTLVNVTVPAGATVVSPPGRYITQGIKASAVTAGRSSLQNSVSELEMKNEGRVAG